MAPTTFHLVALDSHATETSFISGLQALSPSDRPIYVGRCQHWIHAPTLSADALTGTGPEVKKWDYVIVNRVASQGNLHLAEGIKSHAADVWSISADVDNDIWLANYAQAKRDRLAAPVPALPEGWSSSNHKGLDAAVVPSDLEASLGLSAHPLGSRKDEEPVPIKSFVAEFGTKHPGPVNMFNLLAYHPGQRPRYFEYIAAFSASVGSKFGGVPFLHGQIVTEWSSRISEVEHAQPGWQDTAIVFYPSIWHFAKMLDDAEYMDVDRRFKAGALRDNPLICCTEVDVKYGK